MQPDQRQQGAEEDPQHRRAVGEQFVAIVDLRIVAESLAQNDPDVPAAVPEAGGHQV